MTKKLIISATVALIVLIGFLCINVLVQQKDIESYLYSELEYRGYASSDVHEVMIDHSYINRFLSYNEWRISVEFKAHPDILFWFTYRDDIIVFQGVSSEPMLDKEAVLYYSDSFKDGTLLDY